MIIGSESFNTCVVLLGGVESTETYENVVASYSGRPYHNITHVRSCLKHLYSHMDLAREPSEVELALWYHDVVYDPKSSSNEAQSASMMTSDLASLNCDPDALRRIHSMIMATKSHTPSTSDEALVCDLDLSILGAPEKTYELFERLIREEYSFVPVDAYCAGRAKVLQHFLDMSSIYKTSFGAGLEENARRNMTLRIEELNDRVNV